MMVRTLIRSIRRADGVAVVVLIATGIAAYYAVAAIVTGVIGPLIAVFIGDTHFELNSFTIGLSEFRYGAVLESIGTLVLAAFLGRKILKHGDGGSAESLASDQHRHCPKCTLEIPLAATRCPYCTEVLEGEPS